MSNSQILLVAGTHGNEINATWLFDQWSKDYPNLAAKHSIGKSVQGRELLVLRITNGVAGERELRRPMFK